MPEQRSVRKLGEPTPIGTIPIEDEEHTFLITEDGDGDPVPHTEYLLSKAPVKSISTIRVVSGSRTITLEKGTDWVEADTNGDGKPDGVEFINPDRYPANGEQFYVSYHAESIISRYADANDEQLAHVEAQYDSIRDSHYVDGAGTIGLNLQGAMFGQLGKRNNRSNSEYRALLRTIVSIFSGRGTRSGMKEAVGIALGIDTEYVKITEDYEQVGFKVDLINLNQSVETTILNELIDLARPSGSELLEPPVIRFGGDLGLQSQGFSVVTDEDGLDSDTLDTGTLE